MESPLTASELTGTIDEQHQLRLDSALPFSGPCRVRISLLCPAEADVDDREWLRAASHNPAFADLADPAEDIYSLADGKPFYDEA